MRDELTAMVVHGLTSEGVGFAVAALCHREGGLSADRLRAAFDTLRIRAGDDAFDVDLQLAQFAQRECPPTVAALGVSVSVPGASGPSGGIIGDPRVPPCPGSERTEEIGHGLAVAARPGGPGIVVFGPRSLAERVLVSWGVTPTLWTLRGTQSPKSRCDPLSLSGQLCELARRFGAPLAMAVADGTGVPVAGGVAVLQDQVVRWADVPGPKAEPRPPTTAP